MVNMIIDATINGEVPQTQYQDMLATLLGATINTDMPRKTTTQIQRMLISHLILLSEATKSQKVTPKECIRLTKANLDVATEDFRGQQVRINTNNNATFKHQEPHEQVIDARMHQYERDQSSNHQNKNQQKKQHAQTIVTQSHKSIVFVNGFINWKETQTQQTPKEGYDDMGSHGTEKQTNSHSQYMQGKNNADTHISRTPRYIS